MHNIANSRWRTWDIYNERSKEHPTKAAAVRYARTLATSVAIQRRRPPECATDWEAREIVRPKH